MSKDTTEINPFIIARPVEVYINVKTYDTSINGDSTEEVGEGSISIPKKYDSMSRYSIAQNLEMHNTIMSMSLVGLKAFHYIGQIVRYNKDIVLFNTKRFMSMSGVKSRTTVIKGTKELVDAGFIMPVFRKPNYYWINPHVFFKGDRTKMYPNHLVFSKSKKQ